MHIYIYIYIYIYIHTHKTQLRTIEPLGYIVSVELLVRWGIVGVRLSVQTHTHTHTHIYIYNTQLRTIEQLGYIVSVELLVRWGIVGVRLSVQSIKPPEDVSVRVLEFVKTFRYFTRMFKHVCISCACLSMFVCICLSTWDVCTKHEAPRRRVRARSGVC
jgi:secreted Zn-dependent insulinase-like peptidase